MEETKDEMVGCHHQLDGHEFKKALRVGDGQRSLVCCSPWGHKDSNTTEWMNWSELIIFIINFFNAIIVTRFSHKPSKANIYTLKSKLSNS